jgi:hypothetical protein
LKAAEERRAGLENRIAEYTKVFAKRKCRKPPFSFKRRLIEGKP